MRLAETGDPRLARSRPLTHVRNEISFNARVAVIVKWRRAASWPAAIMLLLAFAIAGCGSSSSQHRIGSSSSSSDSASSSSSGATTSVSTTDVGDPTATGASAAGRPLPSGWLGLSMQYKAFPQYAGANASSINPAFLNLIRDIAPNQSPSVRFGGDSTDWTWWPVHGMRQPGGVTYVLTPKWVRTAKTIHRRPASAADPRHQPRGQQRQGCQHRGPRARIRTRSPAHRRVGDRQRAGAVRRVQLVPQQARRRRPGPQRGHLDRERVLQAVSSVRCRDAVRAAGRRSGERLGQLPVRARRLPAGRIARQDLDLPRLPAQALHRGQAV